MRRLLCAAALAVVLWPASAGFSFAQSTVDWPVLCGPADTILGALERRYGEDPVAGGVHEGRLYQLWLNRRTGTWTFILVMPGGTVCALASGEDWQGLAVPGREGLPSEASAKEGGI